MSHDHHEHHHHEHHHHHHHHGHHHHALPNNEKVLSKAFVAIAGFMVIEAIAGYAFNSLTLLADAGHMANDAFSLALAWLALKLAQQAARLSKWLTLVNGGSLMLISLWIIIEAIRRLFSDVQLNALPMILVATVGLIVNIVVAKIMMQADHDNLNVRSAYLHVLADLLGSVVAIVAGLAAYCFGWLWVDTVASAILAWFILKSGWHVSRLAWQNLQH